MLLESKVKVLTEARAKRNDHVPSAKCKCKMEAEVEDKMEADLGDRESDDDSSSSESESELQQQVEQLRENVCHKSELSNVFNFLPPLLIYIFIVGMLK